MVQIRARKGLSATKDAEASKRQSRDGQAGEHSIEDCGSSHPEGSGREGDAGRRLEEDGMPRGHATVVVHQVQKDRAGATAKVRQSVEWNHAARSRKVDGNNLEQGVQLSHSGQGHDNTRREVCRR